MLELFMIVQIALTYCKTNRWTNWRRTPCSIQRGEESNSTLFYDVEKNVIFLSYSKLQIEISSCCELLLLLSAKL